MTDRSRQIITTFLQGRPSVENYGILASMFINKYLECSGDSQSLAFYPGEDSTYGVHQDSIEGFSRIILLLASQIVTPCDSKTISRIDSCRIEEIFINGITHAVTPGCRGYYGKVENKDGRIIAAALIALSLWLTRHVVWPKLPTSSRNSICEWLNSVNYKEVSDNNWHLFIVIVNSVLRSFGMPYEEKEYLNHYNRHKSFYVGNGFYRDGPSGYIDWYNAWEVHPFLILLDQIDSSLDRSFIRETTTDFLTNFIYCFSPSGFPIFGRSICYRLALPTPFILADLYGWSPIPTATVKCVHDSVWKHFLGLGAIDDGVITQGYYRRNLSFLDAYSGPASANWGLFSLASAFFQRNGSDFWTSSAESPLPVEIGDYSIDLDKINLRIVGENATKNVSIHKIKYQKMDIPKLERYTLSQWLLNRFLLKTRIKGSRVWGKLPYKLQNVVNRPSNSFYKYELSEYHSTRPFCEF